MTGKQSAGGIVPAGVMVSPVGVCIQELTEMIQVMEIAVPIETRHVAA